MIIPATANRFTLRALGRQLAWGAAILFVVTLATWLFSLLGTIACAALTGLMLGGARRWHWQIVPVSLVFPAVVVAHLQIWQTGITAHAGSWTALLCWGAFWLAYLGTFIVVSFEKQPTTTTEEGSAKAAPGWAAAPPADELELAQLQGTWSQETTAPDGQPRLKLLEVTGQEAVLHTLGCDGRIKSSAKGKLVSLQGV